MHIHSTGEGNFVHKNRGRRDAVHSDFWRGKRRKYATLTLLSIALLSLVFLGNLSYLYGTASHATVNVHHFRVLYVDYDGGVLGRTLTSAYNSLKGNGFPTLEIVSATQFPNEQSLRNEVCRNRHIYGAVYTHPNASNRLSSAIEGGAAAQNYNSSNAISFIWNGVRYTTLAQADVYSNLQTLILAAGTVYRNVNATYVHDNLDLTSPKAIAAAAQPVMASVIDIRPTTQGVKAFYNTVTVVFTITSQFFYVMALNGIAASFGMFTRLSLRANLQIRYVSSMVWSTTLASIVTGVIWAYRQSWPVTASAGVETWLTYTLVCLIHFLYFDTVTGFVQMQFMPYFALSWIILNVASSNMPLELTPGFYKWHYAMPSYELYQLLVTIWSGGCANSIEVALPVLFAWLILGLTGSWLSMIQKCNAATKVEVVEEQLLEDIERGNEKSDLDLNGPKTAVGKSSSRDITADPGENRPSSQRQISVVRADLKRLEDIPTSLGYSLKTPFQDVLGLTPVRAAPDGPDAKTYGKTISSATTRT